MKVCVPTNRKNEILSDPVAGFPFSWVKGIEPVTDKADADVIFPDFGPKPFTGEVEELSRALEREHWFEPYADKIVWLSICDYPYFSQRFEEGLKLLLSPLQGYRRNRECNVHPLPIHLCHNDYMIQMDRDYTELCRTSEKKHLVGFAGSVTSGASLSMFGGRKWMLQVKERLKDRMFLRDKAGWGFSNEWPHNHREWMQRMAECKYGFAPAGASNGPRGYWLMQVGTVPIFTDVEMLPFEDEVDWPSMSITIPHEELVDFDYDSLPDGNDYIRLRRNAIAFWEHLCWMPNLAKKLMEMICEHSSRVRRDSLRTTS